MQSIDVTDPKYGAQPTHGNVLPTVDATAAIQAALNAAAAPGSSTLRVEMPLGNYLIAGSLTIPPGVQLVGEALSLKTYSQNVYDIANPPVLGGGSVLVCMGSQGNADGTPVVTLGGNSTLQGVVFFYPDQVPIIADTSPVVPFPFAVDFKPGFNGCVRWVNLGNAYQGIRCVGHYRPTIEEVGGYPLLTGLLIDDCRDCARIRDVHFVWENGTQDGDGTILWVRANGIALDMRRADLAQVVGFSPTATASASASPRRPTARRGPRCWAAAATTAPMPCTSRPWGTA